MCINVYVCIIGKHYFQVKLDLLMIENKVLQLIMSRLEQILIIHINCYFANIQYLTKYSIINFVSLLIKSLCKG